MSNSINIDVSALTNRVDALQQELIRIKQGLPSAPDWFNKPIPVSSAKSVKVDELIILEAVPPNTTNLLPKIYEASSYSRIALGVMMPSPDSGDAQVTITPYWKVGDRWIAAWGNPNMSAYWSGSRWDVLIPFDVLSTHFRIEVKTPARQQSDLRVEIAPIFLS